MCSSSRLAVMRFCGNCDDVRTKYDTCTYDFCNQSSKSRDGLCGARVFVYISSCSGLYQTSLTLSLPSFCGAMCSLLFRCSKIHTTSPYFRRESNLSKKKKKGEPLRKHASLLLRSRRARTGARQHISQSHKLFFRPPFHPPPYRNRQKATMTSRDDLVYMAKLAEQAER